jgi:hypothetical protein
MAYLNETLKVRSFLSRLTGGLPSFSREPRRPVLDPRRLSDHLKRDMGFIDGVPTCKRR